MIWWYRKIDGGTDVVVLVEGKDATSKRGVLTHLSGTSKASSTASQID